METTLPSNSNVLRVSEDNRHPENDTQIVARRNVSPNRPSKYRKYTLEQRQRVCELYEDGDDMTKVDTILNVNPKTASEWIRKYEHTGECAPHQRGGARRCIIDELMGKEIETFFAEHSAATLDQCEAYLATKFSETILDSNGNAVRKETRPIPKPTTICDYVNKHGLCFKIAKVIVPQQQQPDDQLIEKRRAYAEWFCHLPLRAQSRVVFVDEFYVDYRLHRSKARGATGVKPRVLIPAKQNVKLNIVAAVSADLGVVLYKTYAARDLKQFTKEKRRKNGENKENEEIRSSVSTAAAGDDSVRGTTGQLFQSYLMELKAKLMKNGDDDRFVIFDNYRTHADKFTLPAFEGSRLVPHFLPPWSPFLNPIENVIGHVKGVIRTAWAMLSTSIEQVASHELQPYEKLAQARERILREILDDAFHAVSVEAVSSYAEKSRSYLPDLLQKKPITNWD
eukprot:ANDGO_07455.mRNA.1 hypothetical protein